MTITTLMPLPKLHLETAIGTPLVGGKVYTYAAGTSNPKQTFTDAAGTTPHQNPIVLNLRGEPPNAIFWTGNYRVEVRDALGNLIYSVDNYNTDPAGVWGLRDDLAGADGAEMIGFEQAGTGTKIRTMAAKAREYVTIGDFDGADSSGVTSSSAAIASAMQHSAGDIVFKRGIWLFDQNIVLASGKRLIAEDGAVLMRNKDVRITSNQPGLTKITATANLDYGRDRVALDAASYAMVSEGDYLYLKNKDAINGDYIQDYVAASTVDLNDPSKWIYQVQVFKVVAKLGNNTVQFDSGASVPFLLTGAGSIYLVGDGVVENVALEGFEFRNGEGLAGSSAEAAFINATYAFDLALRGNTFNLGGMTGGFYGTMGRADIVGNKFDRAAKLAVFLRECMPNSNVIGNTFRAQATNDASIFIEAHNYNISIAGNNFDGSAVFTLTNAPQLISAVQMDAKVRGVSIMNNNVNGYGVGFRLELGCTGNTISGNTIRNTAIAGMRLNQCGQNVISANNLFNCGIAPAPGSLADACGAITLFDSYRNIITSNVIACESDHVKPAFLINGDANKVLDNTLVNAGSTIITGQRNQFARNHGDTLATSQIVMVTGPTSHYNRIEDNDLVDGVPCVYGIRIDNGAECNIVRGNTLGGVDTPVGLSGTTNAQCLHDNRRYSATNDGTVNVYNVEISAPVMPVNAVMPRRFREYSTTTSFGSGALAPQGAMCWEYTQNVPNVGNRFVQLAQTVTTVDV